MFTYDFKNIFSFLRSYRSFYDLFFRCSPLIGKFYNFVRHFGDINFNTPPSRTHLFVYLLFRSLVGFMCTFPISIVEFSDLVPICKNFLLTLLTIDESFSFLIQVQSVIYLLILGLLSVQFYIFCFGMFMNFFFFFLLKETWNPHSFLRYGVLGLRQFFTKFKLKKNRTVFYSIRFSFPFTF